jgi:hypothetical protein
VAAKKRAKSDRSTSAKGDPVRDPAGDPRSLEPSARVALARIEKLRPYRGRRERDVAIAPLFDAVLREHGRAAATLGLVTEIVESIVPLVLVPDCTLRGLTQGVLSIETRSSAAKYALDRFLREGGERTLIEAFGARSLRVSRVKVAATG